MRLGRLLLASLTALAAYSYAQAAPQHATAQQSLRILQVVVPILAHAAEAADSAPAVHTAPHAVLDLGALKATPLAGSLVLVSSLTAIHLISRSHSRQLLRC